MKRLLDPNKLLSDDNLDILESRLSRMMIKMATKPANGGNPFLFALTSHKPHFICNSLPGFKEFTTAATDGVSFKWNPDFILSLTDEELQIVMQHESFHVLFEHSKRSAGKHKKLWMTAIDYFVNGVIWNDIKEAKAKISLWGEKWTPLKYEDYLNILRGKKVDLNVPEGTAVIFADPLTGTKSPDVMYQEFLDAVSKNPNGSDFLDVFEGEGKGKGEGNSSNNISEKLNSLDAHIESKLNKMDLIKELQSACDYSKKAAGTIPGFATELLQELYSPKINLAEKLNRMIHSKTYGGVKNTWKRPRKRYISSGLYIPKKFTNKSKWLCMLDTSGSMSIKDITYGVSQLQSLENNDGIVVPCDSDVKWNHATEITTAQDIAKISVVGRGGTVFESFFKQYEQKLGEDFDIIIVITDGYIPHMDVALAPPIDVIWVITSGCKFTPPFGEAIYL
jgi:predicted metal-dependent peptidase